MVGTPTLCRVCKDLGQVCSEVLVEVVLTFWGNRQFGGRLASVDQTDVSSRYSPFEARGQARDF